MQDTNASGTRVSPLHALYAAGGACWIDFHGWRIPGAFTAAEIEHRVLRTGAGLLDLSHRGRFFVTGRDRATWLNGQMTQAVSTLPAGSGAYSTVLTPQGRMVSDARVFNLGDRLLVDDPAGLAEALESYLDRYLIMERAELSPCREDLALLSVQGPAAIAAVRTVLGPAVDGCEMQDVTACPFLGSSLTAARWSHCGEDGFDLFVPRVVAAELYTRLRIAGGVRPVGWEALNIRRTEAGIPWWGAELDPTIVPFEARLDAAISLNKGCYVGQEIIARIDARGHVNNMLAGFFLLEGPLPPPGTEIRHAGKRVGRTCTALRSVELGRVILLGYLRREHQDPGTRVSLGEAGELGMLEVASLPFLKHGFPTAP